MKILFVLSTAHHPGDSRMGSERQAIGQAMALSDRGHEVVVVNILNAAVDWKRNWDIVNILNCGGPKGPYMLIEQMAKWRGIPVVVTPVYWPTIEATKEIIRIFDYKGDVAEKFLSDNDAHFSGIAPIVTTADWVLPNAESEMRKVIELIGGGKTKDSGGNAIGYTVIPNAVDLKNEIEPALEMEDLGFSDEIEGLIHEKFVLCVGRVEPRKNQHHLVAAMNLLWQDPQNEDLQLVLMGDRSKEYSDYLTEHLKGKHVLLAPPGGPLAVMKMMRRSVCHALISYVESPGLANLEAAALNKPVVISDRGSVRDYFDNYPGVFYCNPNDPYDIANAIKGAMKAGEANELGELVRDQYNYDVVGQKLEAAYGAVIRSVR